MGDRMSEVGYRMAESLGTLCPARLPIHPRNRSAVNSDIRLLTSDI